MTVRYLLGAWIVLFVGSVAKGNDLAGRVVDFNNRPLAGATVLVSTAAPREGVSVYCPSCYLDCGRTATTDAEGQFSFTGLDPTLVFRLVATAEGHRSRVSDRIDPLTDKAQIALEPLPTDLPPDRVVRGRIVDAAGKPVVGAQVEPFGCQTANRRWWGSLPGVDSVSITNNEGEFIITAAEPAEAFDLEVRSPRHAAKRFGLRETGKEHELDVEDGAMIRGRLIKDARPVAGVSVGLVQCDRSSDNFLGEYQIGTRDDGTFELPFVPPNDDFYIYTTMESMKGAGALPLKRVTIGESGTIIDLGDLPVGPAHALSGRIVLTNGAAFQEPIQLLLSREGAWDSQRVMVSGDGTFRFENVPEQEPVTFIARIPGYHLVQELNRFQQVRDWSIALFVEGPRDDIDIHFGPDMPK
jgi:hypothetical protein